MWQARQHQVVWFLRTPSAATSADLFSVVSGGIQPNATFTNQVFDPENPTPFATPTVVQQAQGIVGGRQILATIQPHRVDVFFHPSQLPGQTFNAPVFMDVTDIRDFIDKASARVTEFLSGYYRIGFVSNYVLQFASLEEANNHILKALGIELDYLNQGTELSFGINKKIDIDGFTLNRLCKWQVEVFANMSFVFDSVGRLVPQDVPPIYAAAMMVDLNNEFSQSAQLNQEKAKSLLYNIFSESYRISDIGSPEALR